MSDQSVLRTGKTFVECYKTHYHSMQNEDVFDSISTGEDVESYLMNFFNHHVGDHSDCISAKCKSINKHPLESKRIFCTGLLQLQ